VSILGFLNFAFYSRRAYRGVEHDVPTPWPPRLDSNMHPPPSPESQLVLSCLDNRHTAPLTNEWSELALARLPAAAPQRMRNTQRHKISGRVNSWPHGCGLVGRPKRRQDPRIKQARARWPQGKCVLWSARERALWSARERALCSDSAVP